MMSTPSSESEIAMGSGQRNLAVVFLLAVLASLSLGYVVVLHLDEHIGDEAVHAFQINWFLEGRFEQFEHVTVVPIYHAAVAGLTSLLGLEGLHGMRFANLLLGAIALLAFFRLTRLFAQGQTQERSLLFMFMPFYFPLYFLIYTDMFALAAVLLMVERTVARSYKLAGLLALAALFTRQPNAVWLAYCAFLILMDGGKLEMSREFCRDYVRRAWPLLLSALAFGLFTVVNGGVAVGDTAQHPVSFNPTNVYFMLLAAFVLLFPFCLSRTAAVFALLKARPWILVLLVGMYFVFLSTWEHPHIYNSRELSFYRHNMILHAISDNPWLLFTSYVCIAWMLVVMVTLALERRDCPATVWLLPFAALSVIALPLIEQRYYLPFLGLLFAMLPPLSGRVLATTGIYYVLASGYILHHISRMHFFL
jgi:alpha-1,2-glucosyltransferase